MEVKVHGNSYDDGMMTVHRIDTNKAIVSIGNTDDNYYSYNYEVEATPEQLDVIEELAKKITTLNPHGFGPNWLLPIV